MSREGILLILIMLLGAVIGMLVASYGPISTSDICPREKLGYRCRQGSGIKCDCEKPPKEL